MLNIMCFAVNAADEPGYLTINLTTASETNALTLNKTTGMISATTEGAYAKFEKVQFGKGGFNSFQINAACHPDYVGGTVAIYIDSMEFNPVAELIVQGTGSWNDFVWQTSGLYEDVSGEHDIYVTFSQSGTCSMSGLRFVYSKEETSVRIPNGMIGTEYEHIAKRLEELGLITFGEGSYSATEAVKAKEAAEVLFAMTNVTDETVVNKFLVENDISTTKTIKKEDLCKIIVNVIGYEEIAKMSTNYESECMRIVTSKKILGKLFTEKNTMTRGELYWLVDRLKDEELLVIRGVKENSEYSTIHYSEAGNETILSYYKEIYRGEGIINAGEFATLDGNKTVSSDSVRIGSEFYKVGRTDVGEHVGEYVEFYYTDEPYMEILSFDNSSNDIISVKDDDICSFSNNELIYYTNKNNKTKTVKFEKKIKTFIYNGKTVDEGGSALFDHELLYGSVTVIDNDDDGLAEVIKINDSYDLIVNSYADEVIYSKNNSPLNLKDKNVIVKNSEGKTINKEESLNMLSEWNIVSVECSANPGKGINDTEPIYTIYISNKTQRGTVNSIQNDSDTIWYEFDAGKRIQISKTAISTNGNNTKNFIGVVKPSNYIIACLNYCGEIVAVRYISQMKLGYLTRFAYDNSGLDDKLRIMIFGEDSQFHIYEVGKTVSIDNDRLKKNVAKDKMINNTLVLYQLNEKGFVSAIDFPYIGNTFGENIDTLSLKYQGMGCTYKSKPRTFDGEVFIEADTPVFCVPKNGDDELYYITKPSKIFKNTSGENNKYDIKAYGTDSESFVADWIVYEYDSDNIKPALSANVVYVNNIIQKYELEEKESYSVLEVWDGGKLNEYPMMPNVAEQAEREGIKLGDGITVSTNVNGEINSIVRIISISDSPPKFYNGYDDEAYEEWNGSGKDKLGRYIEGNQYMVAEVQRFDGKYARLGSQNKIYNLAAADLYLYDSNTSRNQFRVAELNEISDKLINEINPSKVFIHVNYGEVRSIVIIK